MSSFYLVHRIWTHEPATVAIPITLDILTGMYGFWNTVRCCCFLLYYIFILHYSVCGQIVQSNRAFRGNILQIALNCQTEKLSKSFFTRKLAHRIVLFRRQHNSMLRKAYQLNKAIVSPLMQIVFCANLPINIIAIAILVHWQLSPGSQIMPYCIIVSQTALLAVFFSICIWLTECMQSSQHPLYKSQTVLQGKKFIGTKLQINGFLELLCGRRRFAFTVGPFGKINRKAIFQVSEVANCKTICLSKPTLISFPKCSF